MHHFSNHRNLSSPSYDRITRKSFNVHDVSFERSEDYKIKGGYRFIERGRGYVRVLVIYEDELRWLYKLCLKQQWHNFNYHQLGCFRGGARSFVVSVIKYDNVRSLELRLFAPYGRRQLRIPEFSSGVGWSFFSNILSEFLPGDSTSLPLKQDYYVKPSYVHNDAALKVPKASLSYAQAAAIPSWQLADIRVKQVGQEIIVNYEDAVENSMVMKRCLVGRIGGPGGALLDAKSISKWVNRKWRIPGGVEVKELDGERFLFIFPSQQLAEMIKKKSSKINGQPLWLDNWHSWCCCSRRSWNENYVWISVIGLPVFLWTESVFRSLGDFCGGFLEAGTDFSILSSFRRARIKVRGNGRSIPASVNITVGQTQYDCPLWVERRAWVDWNRVSPQLGVFRPPESRLMVARGSSVDSMHFPNFGKRKAKEHLKHKVGKLKGPSKADGRLKWVRLGENSQHLKKPSITNPSLVEQSTVHSCETLSDLNEEDQLPESLNQKRSIQEDNGSLDSDHTNLNFFGKKYRSRRPKRTSSSSSPIEHSVDGNFSSEGSIVPFGLQEANSEKALVCHPLATYGPNEDWQGDDGHMLLGNCGQDQNKFLLGCLIE